MIDRALRKLYSIKRQSSDEITPVTSVNLTTPSNCNVCKRSFNVKLGGMTGIICKICKKPSCLICSRTCDSSNCLNDNDNYNNYNDNNFYYNFNNKRQRIDHNGTNNDNNDQGCQSLICKDCSIEK